ncbi:PIN domain-containing protein [Stenotrophomonas maltophilia]|nr:PIN domain-containing protein [Stenotrophomonas maltophilia]
MRTEFIGYFEPTAEETQRLWANAVIALDTNVLLGLYRMPRSSREEIIDVLKMVQPRLWVPYHVMVEYHSNRLKVLQSEYAAAGEMADHVGRAWGEFKNSISKEKYGERACWAEMSTHIEELGQQVTKMKNLAKAERESYIAPREEDTVRTFLQSLLQDRVGLRPANQDAVDTAEENAKARYEKGLGPGTLDTAKTGSHYVDGLQYQRQYGDYMVWSQLLGHCKSQGVDNLIFVTSDVKEDWWLETRSSGGKKPQPELVMEMRRVAGVKNFGMYTLATFARNARSHLGATLTKRTIEDAEKTEEKRWRKERLTRLNAATKLLANPIEAKGFHFLLERHADRILSVDDAGATAVIHQSDGTVTGAIAVHLRAFFSASDRELFERLIETFDTEPEISAYAVFVVAAQDMNHFEMGLRLKKQVERRVRQLFTNRGDVEIYTCHAIDSGHSLFAVQPL